MIAAARALLGTPYADGGLDPATGLDCYGVVRVLLAGVGLKIPADPAELIAGEAAFGRALPPGATLRAGDLVLTRGERGRSHVLIALDARLVAHATRARGVVVEPLARFRSARLVERVVRPRALEARP